MKNTLVLFKNQDSEIDCDYLKQISNICSNCFITFNCVEILPLNDDIGFQKILERNKIASDNLFVISNENIKFDIKKVVSDVMQTNYCTNENARKFLDEFNLKFGSNYSEEFSMIPVEAVYIPNTIAPFNNFMLEDGTFTLIHLSSDIKIIGETIQNFIVKYFENKYNLKREIFTAKYFGDKDKLYFALREIEDKYSFISYVVDIHNGDALVKLLFHGDITKRDYDEVIRLFMTRLSSGIYAEFDTTLSARLFDLLKLRDIRISTAESFTGGRIASSIIENAGASNYLNEGVVCYSNESKMKRVNVKQTDLNVVGAVSSKVAYQMATGLLSDGDCDIAISTTGFAGPTTNENGKPLGLYYIAIGMRDGVDVYKYQGSGSREEITETAKNTALFLTIKKLKNI